MINLVDEFCQTEGVQESVERMQELSTPRELINSNYDSSYLEDLERSSQYFMSEPMDLPEDHFLEHFHSSYTDVEARDYMHGGLFVGLNIIKMLQNIGVNYGKARSEVVDNIKEKLDPEITEQYREQNSRINSNAHIYKKDREIYKLEHNRPGPVLTKRLIEERAD